MFRRLPDLVLLSLWQHLESHDFFYFQRSLGENIRNIYTFKKKYKAKVKFSNVLKHKPKNILCDHLFKVPKS